MKYIQEEVNIMKQLRLSLIVLIHILFTSEEYIDGIGVLYQPNFNPYNTSNNLIVTYNQSGGNNEFKFTVHLEAGVLSTLVFTTYYQRIIGPFFRCCTWSR